MQNTQCIHVGVMDEAEAYEIDDAMSEWQLQRRQTTMTTTPATATMSMNAKLVMMRSGRWNALIKYSTRALQNTLKHIDITNKNYDEQERERNKKVVQKETTKRLLGEWKPNAAGMRWNNNQKLGKTRTIKMAHNRV